MRNCATHRLAVATAAALLFATLWMWKGVEACGPDFEPDIFVDGPDDMTQFAAGHLGILQAYYDSDDYAIAFRYLNGGALSANESKRWAPRIPGRTLTQPEAEAAQKAENDAQPASQWLAVRGQFAPPLQQKDQAAPFPTDSAGNIVFDPDYLNCPNPAFRNAVLTLRSRAGTWGAKSATLAEWIRGQDAVFANCAGTTPTIPQGAPAGSPGLLRADRDYQIAAANFYAKQYDAAEKAFESIARDGNSPWHKWGAYLAARSLVRKAFAMGKPTDPYSGDLATFDLPTMRQAQAMLEDLLRNLNAGPSREAIALELNFVRLRTEPEKRVAEICAALAGPRPDENFNQDLEDLSFALSKGIRIEDSTGLWAWIDSWRAKDVQDAGVTVWQQNHQLPWLVLALSKVSSSNPAVPQLLAAAEKIEPGTPAWDSVFFRRVRLLIALQRNDEARALLDARLPAALREQPSSNANALLGERMAVARNFDEFLEYAPRIVLSQGSEGADDLVEVCIETARRNHLPERCNNADDHPPGFDKDSVQVFNRELPLTRFVEAATSSHIPARLRQDITVAGWVRAVALEDAASAAKLAGLLPEDLRKTAGTGTGFAADLTILRNPGLRPYLEPGVSRLQSYSLFDQLRNNWWSKEWDTNDIDRRIEKQREDEVADRAAAILTKEEVARGEAQYQQLIEDGSGAVLIGQRVVDYAKGHADDPAVPEALALTVRATHYSGGNWGSEYPRAAADNTAVSKAAFQLLHSRYPKSPWTAKTPFYY